MLASNPLLSAEARLLLLAAGPPPTREAVIEALSDPDLDWNRLVALGQKEKATAILWSVLRSHSDSIDPTRARQFGMLASVSNFRMQHHEKLLGKVIDQLEAIGVPVILLKGAALAVTAYGSFARRPMYDLDLLVRPEDGERAWNALRQSGWVHEEEECPTAFYSEHYHLPPLDDPDGTGLAVELHVRPWEDGVQLNADEIWRDSRVIEWSGRRVRVPSVTHQVIHLATHFAWGHMLRSAAWRTTRDLGALIDSGGLDWAEVIAVAKKSGGSSCCFWTFDLARCLVDLPIPDEVLSALRPPVPGFAVDMLRRHYLGTLFSFSPAPCPSLKLERLLWTVGHAPARTGLGDMRPWERGEDWAVHKGTNTPATIGARLKSHFAGLHAWAQYIRSVTGSTRVI